MLKGIGLFLGLVLLMAITAIGVNYAQDALEGTEPADQADTQDEAQFAVAITIGDTEQAALGSYFAHGSEVSDAIRAGTARVFVTIPADVSVIINDGGVNPRYVIEADSNGSFVTFTPTNAGGSSGFAVMTVEVACRDFAGEQWVTEAVAAGKFDC